MSAYHETNQPGTQQSEGRICRPSANNISDAFELNASFRVATSPGLPELVLLVCCCVQLWAKPGPLPQEVQSLAGGFTDAPNACIIEQDAPTGMASWWRYQGFKL